MKKSKDYGLIGSPLSHSISPFVHNEIFKRTKTAGAYSLYEIKPEEIKAKYTLLSSLDGFNVTVPLKELIIPYCQSLDASASFETGGAVNCVKDRVGYNTDIFGFEMAVKALGANLKSRVCLIGFGGSGKAIAGAVAKAGGSLTIAVREPDKVKPGKLKASVVKLKSLKGNFDLLINATPVGMQPKIKAAPVEFKHVNAKFVLDLIYNPAKTRFLTLAEQKGAKTANGLVMLVWQAIKSHEIWYGGKVSEAEAAEIIKAAEKVI
jgi:shikimate dehydrogenase